MYLLKNAWLSITRNKGRNILIAIIFIVIACTSTIALAIKNSANQIISSYDSKYEVEASISMNRSNMVKDFQPGQENQEQNQERFEQISTLTVDEIKNYGDSDYVKEYYYTYQLEMNADSLEKASSEFTTREEKQERAESEQREDTDDENTMVRGDFTIQAYSSYDAMSEFISGDNKIVEGEVSSDFKSDSCIIHEELATLNDIEVGDTITLVDPNDDSITYELEVTGIYQTTNEGQSGPFQMFSNSANTIITNQTVAEKLIEQDENLRVNISPTYILKNQDVIEDFEQEVQDKGLSEDYQITTNLDMITRETEAISNLSNFANVFLIVILMIGGIVLFVINMIHIRERKYEIGVLRTIGMKKSSVVLKFLMELFIVSITSITIGSAIGSLCSVPVANQLLQQEIQSNQNNNEKIQENFGRGGHNMEMKQTEMPLEQVTEIHAAVNLSVLGKVLLIGIILTLVGGISAVVSIANFSPLEILRERS